MGNMPTSEDQLYYSMHGAKSEFEKAKITERMTWGRLEWGKWFGITRIAAMDIDKEKECFVINQAIAKVWEGKRFVAGCPVRADETENRLPPPGF